MKKIISISLLSVTLFSCSKINSVTIEPSVTSMYKGDTSQFKATIKKEGTPDTTINWQIVEPVSQGTTISKDGKLVIDANEKASEITIRAIAADDTTKSNSYAIKITLNPKVFYGIWHSSRDGNNRTATITPDSWDFRYQDGKFYTILGLKWVPIANENPATKDDFPEGYIVSGSISKVNNINVQVGVLESNYFFINRDKTKLLRVVKYDGKVDEVIWSK
jgi:hypothetical protein